MESAVPHVNGMADGQASPSLQVRALKGTGQGCLVEFRNEAD